MVSLEVFLWLRYFSMRTIEFRCFKCITASPLDHAYFGKQPAFIALI